MVISTRHQPLTAAGRAHDRLDPFPNVRTEVEDHPALAGSLLRDLQEKRGDLAKRVVAGQPETFEEYRNLIGQIQGLDVAIAACLQMQGKLQA